MKTALIRQRWEVLRRGQQVDMFLAQLNIPDSEFYRNYVKFCLNVAR